MIKKIILYSVLMTACFGFSTISNEQENINTTLNNWHKAAANANFDLYFSFFTDDAIFIGTDATENWNIPEFKKFAKPYFDRGRAWDFKTIQRNIYMDKTKKIAWFDELLDTHMKICRGSGVLVKIKNQWKIKQYVLSVTVPNETINQVVKVKDSIETIQIKNLKK